MKISSHIDKKIVNETDTLSQIDFLRGYTTLKMAKKV